MQKNIVLNRRLSTDRIPGVPTINQLSNATGVSSQLLSAYLTFGQKKQITLTFNSSRGSDHASTGIYRLRKYLQAYIADGQAYKLKHIPWLAGFFSNLTSSSGDFSLELSVLLSSLKIKKTDSSITLYRANRNQQTYDIQLMDNESGSLESFILEQPSDASYKESAEFFLKEDMLNELSKIDKEYKKQQALSTVLKPSYDQLASLITTFISIYQFPDEFNILIQNFNQDTKDGLAKLINIHNIFSKGL